MASISKGIQKAGFPVFARAISHALNKAALQDGKCLLRKGRGWTSEVRVRAPLFSQANQNTRGRYFSTGQDARQTEVLAQLRGVIDPDLGKDIVELGFVKELTIDGGAVKFTLELTTPACPVKEQFKQDCDQLLRKLPWVNSVSVAISSRKRTGSTGAGDMSRTQGCPGLKDVQRIIAVSSGKGGVGKSTVAVNLAFSIAQLGGRVGILDADIFGPSLPTMVTPPDARIRLSKDNDAMLAPLECQGVKLMSYGYTAKAIKEGAAMMRGPMASNTVHQLIAFTDWGYLDYLVLDLPPGTSDIHMTLCQEVTLDGAIVVTTPQKLSFVDVVKGIDMFDTLRVPILGLVENMSYFDCGCGQRHKPFGEGHGNKLMQLYGIPQSWSIPIQQEISTRSDSGTPFVLASNDKTTKVYADMAAGVVQQISKLATGGADIPLVEYDEPSKSIVVRPATGPVNKISPRELRDSCRCAVCQNKPKTATTKRTQATDEPLVPKNMSPKGRYALAIDWSDGHASIYPYTQLLGKPS